MFYAIILAAGKGSRMASDLPKCAVPILGKPMIEFLIDSIEKSKINKSICVLGHKKEVIEECLKDRVSYVFQDKQLGTAHAVSCAKDELDIEGTTVIFPGDVPFFDEKLIDNLLDYHTSNRNTLTIVTTVLDNPFGYGRIIRKNGKIVKIIEEFAANIEEKTINEVNTGIMCIENKALFEALDQVKIDKVKQEMLLTDIVQFLKKYRIETVKISDPKKVRGINDLATLSIVSDELRKDIVNKHRSSGILIEQPDMVTIGPDVKIEPSATIRGGSFVFGKSVIAAKTIIGPNSELTNSVIGEGSKVVHSVISDSIIGKNTTIGPFAHLRPNTEIKDNVKIGNFVELKNTYIGNKTNVSHLSYVGDSQVGAGVNFGCGAITVNYDGQNKSQTIIGDNTFIGCNSNLIAPLSIGNNCYVAAGSTLTKDLETFDFAITRSPQIIKKNYAQKYNYSRYEEDDVK